MTRYQDVIDALRRSYDAMGARRDESEIPAWKFDERWRFFQLLKAEGKSTLLEIGAGTGVHGQFFLDQGLKVTSTDLSPEMVRLCREKGLQAEVMDFISLEFPGRAFDAVFAMNCLLHVPRADLKGALEKVRDVLAPSGLLYLGQYGGLDWEGMPEDDAYEPKRFFSRLTDEQIKSLAAEVFDIVEFRSVELGWDNGMHFQALLLRRRSA